MNAAVKNVSAKENPSQFVKKGWDSLFIGLKSGEGTMLAIQSFVLKKAVAKKLLVFRKNMGYK